MLKRDIDNNNERLNDEIINISTFLPLYDIELRAREILGLKGN